MNLTLKEVYKVFNKKFELQRDEYISGISVDTRTMKRGNVFFAIKGENTDGHNYIREAFDKGAILVVAEKYQDKKIINVKDTRQALLKLAHYYLEKMKNIKIFAITGSNGKTTVKEILYRILTEKIKKRYVLKSQKSFNNKIGIPLTVFKLNKNHKILVLEIGMNRIGEIKEIMDFIKVNVAVITNIGTSHIGLLKSRDNIAKAKAEIFHGLKKGGLAILNKDSDYYDFLFERVRRLNKKIKIINFGFSKDADFRISNVLNSDKKLIFTLNFKKKKENIETKLPGNHNALNIAAAAAAATYENINLLEIKKAMKNFKLKSMMRLEKKKVEGITIIQDCYNANPDSFKAALQFLRDAGFKNIIAVIGDMYELGNYTRKFHTEVGSLFKTVELKKLIVTGKYSDYYYKGFINAGGRNDMVKIFSFNRQKQIGNYLTRIIKSGDTLFLKGSRKNKLENILNNLKFIYKRR
ncbi:MAG: UDP-N-acetylmuramoyl-tripeptide--D-alanyl-D-alanine ligase [Candidatus Goldbacteria bacterium]|nr:UDP-N-acetylmuramoyl-tripeptide--D-alanyl-D-alanine ligase [Candidatus Goldiibacteriota bacterium]